jgi:hypothetical protein
VGAFVEGDLYLSWMQFFPSPFMPFILFVVSFFIAFFLCFFSQEIIRGHCLGVVTILPTSNFTEMRRLARDDTPFPLAMQPKVISLAW